VDDAAERPKHDVSDASVPEPGTEPIGPTSERVTISGAEVAGERTGELPAVPGVDAPTAPPASAGEGTVHVTGERAFDVPPEGTVDPVTPGQTAVPGGVPSSSPVLPHWTEPATGEVPAVLSRDTGEAKAIMGPTWREEDADWVAHEEEFEPSMFGGDHAELGSLDETGGAAAERRPWEFDLAGVRPGDPGPAQPTASSSPADGDGEPVTEEVPVVRRESEPAAPAALEPSVPAAAPAPAVPSVPLVAPTPSVPAVAEGPDLDAETAASDRAFERMGEPTAVAPVVAAAAAGSEALTSGGSPDAAADRATDRPEDEVPARARPSGTTRLARARRNGLRPRMRAKRPEDVAVPVESPLAAEPPGAAVTEVPGAGRKRSLAGLAADDRTAGRTVTPDSGVADYDLPPETHVGAAAATVATAGAVGAPERRRHVGLRRRSDAEGTNGGPPPRGERPDTEPAPRAPAAARGSSLGLRIGTGVAVGVVALLAFKLGTVPTLVLAMLLVTFAAGECFGVLRRAGYHPATLLGLVATIALMWGAYAKGVAAIPAVLVLLVVFTLVWYLVGIERSAVAGTAATVLTVGWVSLLGAYSALLLAPSIFPDRHGIAFLLGAGIAAVTNDVSALAIGSWIGTRPLAPRISPHKTWEGLVGSAVVTVVVCTVVVGAIHPWDPATAALLGLVTAVVAPLGDLCESLLKRDLHLKDMGTLLPGHGGVLDRLDALLFVVPATYYLVLALHIR
jgi:CDP-diglyceride synthetase